MNTIKHNQHRHYRRVGIERTSEVIQVLQILTDHILCSFVRVQNHFPYLPIFCNQELVTKGNSTVTCCITEFVESRKVLFFIVLRITFRILSNQCCIIVQQIERCKTLLPVKRHELFSLRFTTIDKVKGFLLTRFKRFFESVKYVVKHSFRFFCTSSINIVTLECRDSDTALYQCPKRYFLSYRITHNLQYA